MSKLMKVSFKLLDLFVIFMLTFGSPMSALAQEPGPSLMTDKADYVPSDIVNVSGIGFAAGNYLLMATYPDGATADWGAVVVDETLIFSAASPAPVTVEGSYELTAYAEDHVTVLDTASFTVTTPPPPPAEPELLPFIQSDKPDYAPGELVTLTGGNWQGDEQVRIFVNDDLGQTWSRDVIVDVAEDGTITDSFNLPTWFVATYVVLAGGQQTGRAVTTTFTDLAIGTYDQCANDTGTGYPPTAKDPGCYWIGGNLQSNAAYYAEGDATVQRVWLTDFVPGSTHSVTLKYGTTKGGKHAYDFLTTWDWSEDWITLADRCQTITGCETTNETSLDIPVDPSAAGFDVAAGSRQFKMRGGTLTSATIPTIDSGTYGGDSETVITVFFTVASSGDMCTTKNNTTTCAVALWFGAHVALGSQWMLYNGTTGAGSISGSPYHVALDKVDGAAVGQRDNQMQSNVVTQIPNGHITIVKNAVPNDAQDFNFNVTNNDTVNLHFSLDDDDNATLPNSTTVDVAPGTYYAKELMPLPAGWSLTNLVCVDPTSNTTVDLATGTATINLASDETVTCTYTDANAGQIIVKKITSGGDYSFEFDPSWGDNFFLSNGQTNNSGPLAAGTYSVAEVNIPSTWSLTSATCDDDSPITAIALAEGETVTCTFNNTRVYNQDLTVTKTADESFGRTYTWDIYKEVDKTTANIADGGSAMFNYTVGVTHDNGTDSGWVVSGVITVHNPNSFDIAGIDVTDSAPDGECTVTNGTDLTVPAGGDATANYSCTFAINPGSGTNTAIATWDATAYNTPTGTASGTAGYDFADVTPSITNASVAVTDTLGGNLGTVSYTDPSPTEFTYSYTFSGVGGTCTKYDNTATINENGKYAKKTVEVCVGKDLTVSKTATASLSRTYKWLIDKSVDDTLIEIAEGGTATFNYSVKVTPNGSTDSGWTIGGTITIANPNDWEDVTVDVTDTLDKGGTCTITEAAPYVVPRSGSLTLHYTCTTDGTTTKNTAAVTWNKDTYYTPSGSASDEADVSFGLATETHKTITVIDDKTDPANPVTLGTWDWADGEHIFTYSLDKQGVAGECTDYTNTAVIDETEQPDSQKVTVCVGKDLTVTKTATAAYNRLYKWTIDKSVDKTTINIAEGGTATFNYSVLVSPTGYEDSGWTLGGTIIITNPNAWEDITADVTDALDTGGTCTVTGGNVVLIEAGTSVTLDYTCEFFGEPKYTGKNTATVIWDEAAYFTPSDTATAQADVNFTLNGDTNKVITVVDDKTDPANPVTLGTWDWADGEYTFTYSLDKQGMAGECTDYTNTAVIDETNQSDSQTVTICVGKDLTVTKTAFPSFTRTWDWTITKDADETYNLFAGQSVAHTYKVTVTPNFTDSAWKVVGVITITNPNDWEDIMLTGLSDVADGGTCTVDPTLPIVPRGGSVDVNYTCTWATQPSSYSGTNTATATWDQVTAFTPNGSANGSKGYEFTNPAEINPVITVDDNNLTGEVWSADRAYAEWTYTQDFSCSNNPEAYAGDGYYDYFLTNTATINETTGDNDSATVIVRCYAPVVSKTAAGTYDERHEWDVEKTVSPVSQSAFAGDTVSYEWTVVVTEKVTEETIKVAGEITVINPAPMDMIVDLFDELGGGTDAVIGTCTGGTYSSGTLTIPANTSAVCAYTAIPGGRTDTINNVAATLNGIDFDASATFDWTANLIRGSATLDDDQNPAFPKTLEDGDTFTYTEQYTCSTDKTAYDATTHKYTFGEKNTATLTSGIFTDSSEVSTAVDCYVPVISKDAYGSYQEVHDWEIFKTGAAAQKKFAGQSAGFSWTVRVDETTHGENYLVTGEIIITNPNPEDALIISLNDVLDDGSIATITACTGGTWADPTVTVPAGGTATCDYSVAPSGNLDTFATALPAQVSMKVDYPESGDPAYFEVVTITGGAALNGTYEGWCIDQDHTIAQNTNYTANVFSSYESLPVGLVEHPENFDLVNWIINQDFVYTAAYDNLMPDATTQISSDGAKPGLGEALKTYTYGDVQRAIWELVDDSPYLTSSLSTWSQNRVNEIKAMAAASGENFKPTCGEYVAVVLQPVGGQQPITIAQVTFASLGVSCAESNTVTAVLNGVQFPASAEILWTATPVNPTATLDDTQNPLWPITVDADTTFTYTDPQGYTCPSDPVVYIGDGIAPVYNDSNTATITYVGGSKSSTASTSVTCYAPIVSKTASAEWRKKYDWSITKTATPDTHTGFAGDSFTSAYDVFVDQTITDYGYLASGVISVKNPDGSPGNMTVNVADMVSGGFAGTVDCDPATTGNQTSVVVAANTTKTCNYTASLPDNTSRVNTATGTFNNIAFPATANVTFGAPIIEGYPTINVTDSVQGALGLATEDTHFTYSRDFSCSTNASDYTNYADTDSYGNTATIDETGAKDDASVTIACYIPEISKTAAGAYNERHEWTVEKTVTPLSQAGFPGDSLDWTWTVEVTEDVYEENFDVTGTITVVNPNPEDALVVALSDTFNNGVVPIITSCTGGTYLAGTLTVPAGKTTVCNYDALDLEYDDDADAPTSNNAQFTLYGILYSATDAIEWTPTVIRGTASLNDDQFPLNESLNGHTQKGTYTFPFTYDGDHTCSINESSYGEDYTYSNTLNNTAIVSSNDVEQDQDDASTSYTCYWPQIKMTKSGDTLSKIGDPVTYTFKLENLTPTAWGMRALSCTISDPIIGFSKPITLASGASDTSTKDFTIPTNASDPFVNTASVTCSPLGSTFSVSDSAQWSTNLFQPKVEIIKTGPLYATSGDVITYSFTINNLSSGDSPNLMLDTISDNKVGDLKTAALAAGCDNLVYNGTCTFTANYTVPDVGLQATKITNVVSVLYHPKDFPNDITDTDDHTITVTPKSQLTDTSFCPLNNNQFRLLYHLEVAPNIYRLQASNPGQYYFNGFYFGEPGTTFTMDLQIPYPFVTQEGAGNPIQVHDGTSLTSSGCYLPNPSLTGFTITTPAMTPTSNAGKQIITPEDYSTKNLGSYTTVTVSGTVPATGMAYVTIHLDYGLKKTGGWKMPGTSTLNPVSNTAIPDVTNQTGFGSGPVTIHGYETYNFARTVGSDTSTTTPSSFNEFKKFAGFLGFVIDQNTEEGVSNTKVVIYNPLGKILATVYTDADGYYMYAYKHTAKAATYKITLPGWAKSVSMTVKSNGLAAVNFDVP